MGNELSEASGQGNYYPGLRPSRAGNPFDVRPSANPHPGEFGGNSFGESPFGVPSTPFHNQAQRPDAFVYGQSGGSFSGLSQSSFPATPASAPSQIFSPGPGSASTFGGPNDTPLTSYAGTPSGDFCQSPAPGSPFNDSFCTPSPAGSCSKCGASAVRGRSRTLDCGHTTCFRCIGRLAHESIRNAALGGAFVPVQCCFGVEVPLSTVGEATQFDVWQAYRERLHETNTPATARLYCHKPECGMFISAAHQRPRSGTCPLCKERTCRACGRRSHMFPCPPGTEFQGPPQSLDAWLKGGDVASQGSAQFGCSGSSDYSNSSSPAAQQIWA